MFCLRGIMQRPEKGYSLCEPLCGCRESNPGLQEERKHWAISAVCENQIQAIGLARLTLEWLSPTCRMYNFHYITSGKT